jgi:hypothetical protein
MHDTTPKPLALDDEQLNIVKTYANPLVPWQRDRYLRTLARELERCETIGSGTIARIARDVQQRILAMRVRDPKPKRAAGL